jgi:hypothetical protein
MKIVGGEYYEDTEEMSPDGRRIMSAFSSDYIFSVPHLTPQPMKTLA